MINENEKWLQDNNINYKRYYSATKLVKLINNKVMPLYKIKKELVLAKREEAEIVERIKRIEEHANRVDEDIKVKYEEINVEETKKRRRKKKSTES